jgi:AcrR family transcriptional regulator
MAGRDTYHHGDLRAALVAAGVEAARGGGEGAVRLNRLAAQVGVSPAAAYRHFPGGLEELLTAVGDVCRAELAERLVERVERVGRRTGGARRASARFRASGLAYVEYVTEQPGLFQVATRHDGGGAASGPYTQLEQYLDDLVSAGVLPAGRRPWAPAAAWATVHGLALLLTEGPLRRLSAEQRREVVDRTLDMVEAGL